MEQRATIPATTDANIPAAGPRSKTAGAQAFELFGHEIPAGQIGAAPAQRLLARAWADHVRPRCLCRPGGVNMYVAKITGLEAEGAVTYLVKRMPDSGLSHGYHCPSYLPPEELSGLGGVLGTAIDADTESGMTALRLGFRLSRIDRAGPTTTGTSQTVTDSASADPNRLSLRAVLHYLWHEADLATWSPGMQGKRNWHIVSWHVRAAAAGKYAKGKPLLARLYVPEPFTATKRSEIGARRLAAWAPLHEPTPPTAGAQGSGESAPGGRGRHAGSAGSAGSAALAGLTGSDRPDRSGNGSRGHASSQQFMILLGEVKAIEPARFGHKLVIKHMPDAPLMVEDALLARINRRFGDELELWQLDDEGHLLVIATFSVSRAGLATAEEVCLVMTDRNWLPYDTLADKLLLDHVVAQRRRFTKSMRYNLGSDKPMASLVLTDTEPPAALFVLERETDPATVAELADHAGTQTWTWIVDQPLPVLPPALPRAVPSGARGAQLFI